MYSHSFLGLESNHHSKDFPEGYLIPYHSEIQPVNISIQENFILTTTV